jgi:hypothetical protein
MKLAPSVDRSHYRSVQLFGDFKPRANFAGTPPGARHSDENHKVIKLTTNLEPKSMAKNGSWVKSKEGWTHTDPRMQEIGRAHSTVLNVSHIFRKATAIAAPQDSNSTTAVTATGTARRSN